MNLSPPPLNDTSREEDCVRIWEFSQELLMVSDHAGVWRNVNPAWFELLGWTREDLVGRTSEWLKHPDDHAKTREQIDRLARGEKLLSFENRLRARDGSYHTLAWHGVNTRIEQAACRLVKLDSRKTAARESVTIHETGAMTEWLCETSAPHLWREPGAEGRLGWLDWLHFGEILKDWLTNAESLLEEFSGVDCQVGYSVWMASQAVSLEDYPAVSAYLDRCAGRPALRAAIG